MQTHQEKTQRTSKYPPLKYTLSPSVKTEKMFEDILPFWWEFSSFTVCFHGLLCWWFDHKRSAFSVGHNRKVNKVQIRSNSVEMETMGRLPSKVIAVPLDSMGSRTGVPWDWTPSSYSVLIAYSFKGFVVSWYFNSNYLALLFVMISGVKTFLQYIPQ